MTKTEIKKSNLIKDILTICKASNMFIDGDLFFGLAFRTIKELNNILSNLK